MLYGFPEICPNKNDGPPLAVSCWDDFKDFRVPCVHDLGNIPTLYSTTKVIPLALSLGHEVGLVRAPYP